MTEFGLMQATTQDSLQPVELARFAEDRGFDAIFMGEHTHLPTAPRRGRDQDWATLERYEGLVRAFR